jgi:DNA primase catalytic core
MARIPDAELERLKAEVSVQRLVEAKGIALKRHGADLLGLCPFHDDKSPSLVVSPKKNLWHCLGACQTGGSVIDWVMRTDGVSFRHAVTLLREGLPASSLAASPRVVRQSTVPKLPPPVALDADDRALLDQVIDYYHATLKQSPEALAYLDKRGIYSMEVVERFKLGYANRTLGLRLPEKNRKAGAEIRERLQALGLWRASGHEHFNGSLVIPVLDEDGHVTGVYGRKILDNLRPGTAYHLYLPGPHRGVFNRAGLLRQAEVILCEALIDALTFWRAGYRNVTSSYGINGFTADILDALKVCGAKRVLIAYDRDDAGERAAMELAPKLQTAGVDVFRLLFPKGMDANSYALSVKPPEKSLGVVIRSAQWLGAGTKPALTSQCFNTVTQWVTDTTGEAVADRTAPSAPSVQDATSARAAEVALSSGTAREGIAEQMPAQVSTLSSADTPALLPLAATVEPSITDAVVTHVPALPAAAVPDAPAPEAPCAISEQQLVMVFGDRHYRVRGLAKATSYEVMKVNVLVTRGEVLYVDTVDLYSAKHRQAFARAAAGEFGVEESVIQRDLGKLLLKLEQHQDQRMQATLSPAASATPALSQTERDAALALLKSPDLIERIGADFARCGLVGESANTLVGYLACVSRKLEQPLAVIIQSTSAAGKSTLMDAVLALVPEEDRVHYSAMTGQSLFYLGEQDLKHKILAIAEEEGVRQAAYALKVLQSQGELTIASTGKDPATGLLVTQEYRVEGPVMLFLTTTAIDLDEELLNRCVVLTINESREQTRAIQQRQRAQRTLQGLIARADADAVLTLHRNAQRLLRPLAVVNAYAEQLTFLDDRTRTRRDHQKYLALIDSIALLHQHQRPVRTLSRNGKTVEYIEVELTDIALANRLAHEVLGRSLDELPPQTRRVLQLLDAFVTEQQRTQAIERHAVRFTRRDVRAIAGLSDTQARLHLERLLQLEYVIAHTGRNGQRFVYELMFDGDVTSDAVQCIGLMDVAALSAQVTPTTETSRGETPELAGRLRAARGDLTATLLGDEIGRHASTDADLPSLAAEGPQTALFPVTRAADTAIVVAA